MVIFFNAWFCENWTDIETKTIGFLGKLYWGFRDRLREIVLVIISDIHFLYVHQSRPVRVYKIASLYSGDLMSSLSSRYPAYGTFDNRQKTHNLVFPEGLTWDREKLENLTEVENDTFKLIRSISANYETEKQEKKEKPCDFSFVVDQTLRISNLSFIEGLLHIQSFIDELDR